jgi:prephenate dehydratase
MMLSEKREKGRPLCHRLKTLSACGDIMRIACLGPEGTFTEQAAHGLLNGMPEHSLMMKSSIEDVFESVGSSSAEYGVVPIENSVEGGVNTTLDTLIFDSSLFIKKQMSLPITQNLMINGRNSGKKITRIISHGQALAQSRKFIAEHYPGIKAEIVNSTAEAAKIVSECSTETIAAIGSAGAAERYGLNILHENIQEGINNTTQFILLTKEDTSYPRKGCSTSVVFATKDKPGELSNVLDIFSIWDLNMTKILSRPTKNKQGEYVFFIEVSDYTDEADVTDALKMIERKTIFFRNLGTYDTLTMDR